MIIQLHRFFLSAFLFLFPWQTIWISRERFRGGVKLQYETIGFYAIEIFLWGAIICFLFWFYKEWKRRHLLFALACLAFILFAYASSLWSPDPGIARQHALWITEALLVFFLLFLRPLQKKTAWRWFVLGSIAPSILGIAQFVLQTTWASTLFGLTAHPAWAAGTSIVTTESGRWLRAYGPLPHPNLFGGYLVVAIILTDQLLSQKNKRFVNCQLLIVSCLQWTALFFTFSRSAWLAAIVWLVVFTLRRDRRYAIHDNKRIIAYRLSLIAILAILFFPLVHSRIASDSIPETRSKTERISGYREAVAIWKTSPIIGVGLGNYTIAASRLDTARASWEYQPVHNVPLLILAELGLVGAFLFILAFVSLIFYLLSLTHGFNRLSSIVPLLPLALLDHYLWSSGAGLLLIPFFFIPNSSTTHPLSIVDTPPNE